MHNAAFRACGLPHSYGVLELPDQGGLADVNSETSQQFRDYLASPSFGGLSVTIPHKLRVQPFLDELTDSARKIGAVNTITPRPALVTSRTTLGGASVLTCVEIKFTARSRRWRGDVGSSPLDDFHTGTDGRQHGLDRDL